MAATVVARSMSVVQRPRAQGRYIVFLVPADKPGDIDETDPVPYDPAQKLATPPEGAPPDVLGWYTFERYSAAGERLGVSPKCYYGGERILRKVYVELLGGQGPSMNLGGSTWVIILDNGAVVAYNRGDQHFPRR